MCTSSRGISSFLSHLLGQGNGSLGHSSAKCACKKVRYKNESSSIETTKNGIDVSRPSTTYHHWLDNADIFGTVTPRVLAFIRSVHAKQDPTSFVFKNRKKRCPTKGKGKETLFIHGIQFKAGSLRGRVGEMNVGFWGEGKTGVPGEKPLGAGKRTITLSPHETPDLRIEPGSHWWECSHHYAIPAPLLSSLIRLRLLTISYLAGDFDRDKNKGQQAQKMQNILSVPQY